MNIKIVEFFVKAIKNITEMCNKTIDSTDGEKLAKGVNDLNKNIDETYEQMRNIIIADEKLSSEKKLAKLEKLAKSQAIAKKNSEEAIMGNKEQVGKTVKEVIFALTTCGLSCLPVIVKEFKSLSKKGEILLESDVKEYYIEGEKIEGK